MAIFAAACVATAQWSPTAAGQQCNCSCDSFIPPNQLVQAAFLNDGGGGPTHYVTAGEPVPGGGCANQEVMHANEFVFPGGTVITDVCVNWKFPTGQSGSTAYLFFKSPDANNNNLPGNTMHEEPFPINANGGHQILHLQNPQAAFGLTWVGVRYPDARCYLTHQGIGPLVARRAAVLVNAAGAGGWRDYNDPLVLQNGGPAYGGRAPLIRPLTLAPNPGGSAGVFVNTGGVNPLLTDECGASASFSVALTRAPAPGRSVLVILGISNPSEAEFNGGLTALLFNGSNWSTPQLVEVVGRDDPLPDGDQPYQITFTVSSLDPAYHGLPVAPLNAINEDNDNALVLCPQPPSAWRQESPATVPPERYFSAAAYDSGRRRVVMFGGTDAGANAQGDTWEWDGSDWRLMSIGGPQPRERHAMAYDSVRRVTVLYGGMEPRNGALFEDTWEWDGVAWIQRSAGMPNAPGGPRAGHEMIYEPAGQRVILYGGEFTADTNTWFWDGNTWFNPSFATNPGLRWGHAMSYDSLRNRTYLFGGAVAGGVSETWELDSANGWQQVGFPFGTPANIGYPEMVYDAARDRHVLFGGLVFGGPFMDQTWEWDATRESWTMIMAQPAPSPRSEYAMAYDAANNRTVLFGGAAPGAPPGAVANDTWTYQDLLPFTPVRRTFCISGVATGATWHWALRGLGIAYVVDVPVEPGIAAGSNADALTQHFVDRVNRICCDTLRARVLPTTPTCFEIEVDSPIPFDLFVGPVGGPECLVTTAGTCTFNPEIREVALSGGDCDNNGIDDALDIAVDPSLDANGNGQLDGCETFILGDMNCDLVVTVGDISGFVLALTNPAAYAAQYPNCNIMSADMNQDGVVSVGDIGAFVAALLGP
ncbi:MAG: hypothetical protein SF069_06870 [Phycisphaerae bacterium]|nr:hypothetical protein [Phycisphaerae bacterium]